ncbi:MAG TPA: PilZ domain-containing protein [Sphingobium sp.]
MTKPMSFPVDHMCQREDASLAGATHSRPANAPERRRTPRFRLKPKLFLVRLGGLPAAITLRNISCGGASGLMSEPVPEGARLILELDPRTHVEAKVTWISKMVLGLTFITPLEPPYVEALARRCNPQG